MELGNLSSDVKGDNQAEGPVRLRVPMQAQGRSVP